MVSSTAADSGSTFCMTRMKTDTVKSLYMVSVYTK